MSAASLAATPEMAVTQDGNEIQELIDEKESTQQSLRMCMELSMRIQQWESTSRETSGFTHRPSSYKHTKTAFGDTRDSIDQLVLRLRKHEEDIDRQLTAIRGNRSQSTSATEELSRLQETKESFNQCIKVVSRAREDLAAQRRNVFEDVNLDDQSYAITVSTIGDLVTARQVVLKKQSRYIGGQINPENYQATIEKLTQLDIEKRESFDQESRASEKAARSRYGRGFTLAGSSTNIGLDSS
jgi:hypothetical protein